MVLEGQYGNLEPLVRATLAKVTNANQRLIQLVDDLLLVARTEAGKIPIKVSSIELPQSVLTVISELKPLADKKNIDIKYEPPINLPKVMADSDRLKEILVNLIGNAIRYTPDVGTITVTHKIQDNRLIISIKDTGIGINKENQKKLFEKYFRVESEQTKDIQGTGLGLFIVKQIVEKMNGQIWIESEEGKGSTFSFSLLLAV